MYANARNDRLTAGWVTSNSSADAEILSSLTSLRARSRALVRDAAYARRAKAIVVNNVIGSGIGMQAQVETTRKDDTGAVKYNDRVNNEIEELWRKWSCAEYCHTGGVLDFGDIERMLMGQIFEAGEVLIREYPIAFGGSPVPYALEVIEPERLAEEYQSSLPTQRTAYGNVIRMGVEVDKFGRPMAYLIREGHPGDYSFLRPFASEKLERVSAEFLNHMYVGDRWPQTRGVPWMHAMLRKLNDLDEYGEAELVAARGAASYMATIESEIDPGSDDPSLGEEQEDGSFQIALEPGLVPRLRPGETLNPYMPNRPNSQIDPFMRLMIREAAAGTNTSYESLSRDFSQSNYSSSRLAQLDDREMWRTLQMWFIRKLRYRTHKRWLQQAVFSRALQTISIESYAADPSKFEKVRYKPRGWNWIDPEKEVNARIAAIKAGLDTLTNAIAETGSGRDVEDVFKERRQEIDLEEKYKLTFETSPAVLEAEIAKASQPSVPPMGGKLKQEDDTKDDGSDRKVISLKGSK